MSNDRNTVNLTRVVIALDQALESAGTCALLERTEEIEVVGEAATASDLIENLRQWQPDLVLLDILLPGLFDIDMLRVVSEDFPQVRMIVLTGPESLAGARGLIPGAAGYLSKNISSSELVSALRTVASGGAYSSSDIAERGSDDPVKKLTRRQTQVLEMIALGHSTKQIGQLLGISAKTVETYRAQIIDKLEIHTLAGLVRYAMETQPSGREE